MAQEQEYEVEIVDDSAHYVEDSAPETDEQSPEDKATEQAKAEQEGDDKGGQKLTAKQRRSKYKERIDELTRKYREEERTRYQIERERDQEREQFQEYQNSFQQEQKNSARIVFSTLSDNKKLLESHLETARKMGDTKTENQIQDKLTDVRERMGRLRQYYPDVESDAPAQPAAPQGTGKMQPQGQPQPGQQPDAAKPQQGQQQALPSAAKDWIDSNSWLKDRTDLHATINAFDTALKAQGKDPATPEFYAELTKKLKSELPQYADQLRASSTDDLDDLLGSDDEDDDDDDQQDAGAQARQEQRPANTGVSDGGRPAPRGANGKRKVKLTRDEQAIAQRLGISNEEYAKQKVRAETNTGYHTID